MPTAPLPTTQSSGPIDCRLGLGFIIPQFSGVMLLLLALAWTWSESMLIKAKWIAQSPGWLLISRCCVTGRTGGQAGGLALSVLKAKTRWQSGYWRLSYRKDCIGKHTLHSTSQPPSPRPQSKSNTSLHLPNKMERNTKSSCKVKISVAEFRPHEDK